MNRNRFRIGDKVTVKAEVFPHVIYKRRFKIDLASPEAEKFCRVWEPLKYYRPKICYIVGRTTRSNGEITPAFSEEEKCKFAPTKILYFWLVRETTGGREILVADEDIELWGDTNPDEVKND